MKIIIDAMSGDKAPEEIVKGAVMARRELGVDVPADVYTIPYAVKMILAAKARRDAGETLVLPRNEEQKGGAAGC